MSSGRASDVLIAKTDAFIIDTIRHLDEHGQATEQQEEQVS